MSEGESDVETPPPVYLSSTLCDSEKAQRAQWSAENDRRRHNFVPLIMEVWGRTRRRAALPQAMPPPQPPPQIMSQLAQRGKLLPLLEAGTERAREERAKALARRRAEAAAAAGAMA